MKVLGLDLGGHAFGYALLDDGVAVRAGRTEIGFRPDPTSCRLRRFHYRGLAIGDMRVKLVELLDLGPEVVAYEKVRRHIGTDAAHVYGAMEGAVLEVLDIHTARQRARGLTPIQLVEVGVQEGKRALCGEGGNAATKEEMAAAAERRWPRAAVNWSAGKSEPADAAGIALSVTHPVESKTAREKREAKARRAARASKGAP